MQALQRCKYCGVLPYSQYTTFGWQVHCPCDEGIKNAYHYSNDWDEVVTHWNKAYGIEEEICRPVYVMQEPPVCNCQSRDLMWYGCRCNYAKWKALNKKC